MVELMVQGLAQWNSRVDLARHRRRRHLGLVVTDLLEAFRRWVWAWENTREKTLSPAVETVLPPGQDLPVPHFHRPDPDVVSHRRLQESVRPPRAPRLPSEPLLRWRGR